MISQYLGFDSDLLILGLTVIVLVLFIMMIVVLVQTYNLKKNYGIFMTGKNAKNLEEILVTRLNQIDDLLETVAVNSQKVEHVSNLMGDTFQKYGLVKYNALDEMGGKLSFTLAMLNEKNNGFVLNAVHSNEGCYTYIKEIIAGNAVTAMASEEQEALDMALGNQRMKNGGRKRMVKLKTASAKKSAPAPAAKPEPKKEEPKNVSHPPFTTVDPDGGKIEVEELE